VLFHTAIRGKHNFINMLSTLKGLMLRYEFYFIFWRYGLRFFDNGQLSIIHSIVYWNGLFARSDFGLVKQKPEKREASCKLYTLSDLQLVDQVSMRP
jgi:hypothetical protein